MMIHTKTTIPEKREFSNRQGRIKIPSMVLSQDPMLVLRIFDELRFVPIDIKSTVFDMYVEYRGISPTFTPVEPGSEVPFYTLDIVLRGYDEKGVPRITKLETALSGNEYGNPVKIVNYYDEDEGGTVYTKEN